MKTNAADPVKEARAWVDDFYDTGCGNLNEHDLTDLAKSAAVGGYLAGYKAAQAIVENELQAVQAQRVKRPGLGSAEYALKAVLAKMGCK